MALIPNDFDIDTDLQKNEYKIALIPNDFALFRYELSATKVAQILAQKVLRQSAKFQYHKTGMHYSEYIYCIELCHCLLYKVIDFLNSLFQLVTIHARESRQTAKLRTNIGVLHLCLRTCPNAFQRLLQSCEIILLLL